MFVQRRQILLNAAKLFDLLIMIFCFALSGYVEVYSTGNIPFSHFLSMRIKVHNFLLFAGFLCVWHLLFSGMGLYNSRRLSSWWSETLDILKATTIGTFIMFAISVIFNISMINNTFLLPFWAACSSLSIIGRLSIRYVLKKIRVRGRNLRHMLIIGTNNRAVQFVRKVESRPELGYCIVGFVDKNWEGMREFYNAGYELAANLGELQDFLNESVVDEIMIALPVCSYYDRISKILTLCEQQGIIVRFLGDFFNTKLTRIGVDHFDNDCIITQYAGNMRARSVLIKRLLLDIPLSLIVLVVLSPLFLFIPLLIKVLSTGPVFFVQHRLGLNKRKFSLYKFRTMIPGAEEKLAELEHLNEVKGAAFKIKDDPRITPLGRFLRKTSLDELPQLFNVLSGDMSLVGPRPLPIRDYNNFQQDWHRRRFSVRPGVTCLWQVNGRSHCSFDKWMELDMQYIDNWSLWLDLKILLKTIPAVLKGDGAA